MSSPSPIRRRASRIASVTWSAGRLMNFTDNSATSRSNSSCSSSVSAARPCRPLRALAMSTIVASTNVPLGCFEPGSGRFRRETRSRRGGGRRARDVRPSGQVQAERPAAAIVDGFPDQLLTGDSRTVVRLRLTKASSRPRRYQNAARERFDRQPERPSASIPGSFDAGLVDPLISGTSLDGSSWLRSYLETAIGDRPLERSGALRYPGAYPAYRRLTRVDGRGVCWRV